MTLARYDESIREAECITLLCGTDEAGRGPLAGPVYAAAVILPPNPLLDGLNDSKKLTGAKRERLFAAIMDQALASSIASADVKEIEQLNILGASMLAMRRAVEGLGIAPERLLVDGTCLPHTRFAERAVIRGDSVSACIAAASILAKVARDRHMLELAKRYPEYMFQQHKGYGTKLHYEKLDEYGPCPVHRESFLKKWRLRNER